MTINSHVCEVDCVLTIHADGRRSHMMYPSDPTPHAGRYQNTVNRTLNRRDYRASGQDESRNVREWNKRRADHIRTNFEYYGEIEYYPMRGIRAINRLSEWIKDQL